MKINIKLIITVVALMGITVFARGKDDDRPKSLSKPDGSPTSTHFNINNISTWFYADGKSDISPTGSSGFVFPKGSGSAAVYQTGFVFGATVNGEKKVGGSAYRTSLLPGRIMEDGTAMSPDDPAVRIYRVRRDYKTGSLAAEMADEGKSEEEIRAQYEKDWNEWPAAWGAPYEDVNGNGQYDPSEDIPGIPGADQTIWFVGNDLNEAQASKFYGTKPMKVEVQGTIWGYSSSGPLGNMLFRKYTIINKSGEKFEDMYVSTWSDPDVGDAGDDYVGVDTTLSLSFAYNGVANDGVYKTTPPAVGFDFFQGPIVDGDPEDEAIFNLKRVKGKKNLKATAHYFFINSDPVYSDPDQDSPQGTIEFHNLFRGKISTTGGDFTDPTTGKATKFALAGDPLTGKGWVDGILHPPGDRRMGMVSGPFSMEAGDTQEVVVAEIAAGAFGKVDRLGAVGLLKYYDKYAQNVYDNLFDIVRPPQTPEVKVVPLDRGVILNWAWNKDVVNSTETFDVKGYKFEGYNVYQLPSKSANFENAVRIATFDLNNGVGKVFDEVFDADDGVVYNKVVQFGSDSGIKRTIKITEDFLNSKVKLNNGSRYYFAITSYAYNSNINAVPRTLENSLQIIEVIPENIKPGEVTTNLGYEDKVTVSRENVSGDASFDLRLVDPTATTGENYKIEFSRRESDSLMVWKLKNSSGTVLTENNRQNTKVGQEYYFDGLNLVVDYVDKNALSSVFFNEGAKSWFDGVNWDGGFFHGSLDYGANFFGSTYSGEFPTVVLKFAGIPNTSVTNSVERANLSKEKYPDRWSKGATYFRKDGKYVYNGTGELPMAAYDMSDPENPRRLNLAFRELSEEAANQLWDLGWDGAEFGGLGNREYLFIMSSDYNEGTDYNQDNFAFTSDVIYAFWPAGVEGAKYLNDPYEMTIYAPLPPKEGDVWTFKAPDKVSYSAEKAKKDVEKINVFPNPYYGVNPEEINKYQRFVTFNHLPQKATIKIVNLAGQLIKVINKDNESQFEKWDLTNRSGLPVASGLYLAYIDMPELGKTKVLKVAVILEQQILDRF